MNPVEIELKFQVPPGARERLHKALATATARTGRLRAIYFDTADQRLAAAGFALRLRHEGTAWVQTLKGRGDGLMTRLEHELRLPVQPGVPALDPARHAGTPAGDALAALLSDGAPLEQRYRTDIRRLLRRVRSGGATIELAFDRGFIFGGRRRLEVCELEFELIAGPPVALLDLAQRWVARHGLWLDVRSKSERGHRLALGLDQVPAVQARPLSLTKTSTTAEAFSAMLQSSLEQLLPNAAEIAGGSGGDAALHQLRVAIRRLRTALRHAADWSPDPQASHALEIGWQQPFAQLGAARDLDVMTAWLQPALAAAGAPPPRSRTARPLMDVGRVVRDPAFSLLVIQTLKLSLAPQPAHASGRSFAPGPAAPAAALADAAAGLIKRAWRRVRSDAIGFAAAPVDERHRARKRLKRLRYLTEFLLPLLPARAARRALPAMGDALEALGEYNDLLVARSSIENRTARDPRAWFALGWLAARHDASLARAARRLKRLAAEPRFWR